MSDIKEKITNQFDKSKFKLLNCETAPDDDWKGVDAYIRDFIKELNNSPHISTIFSCEGHGEEDDAYLMFNVSKEGWDIFWNKVLPELSYNFCFINPEVHPDALYQVQWQLSVHHDDSVENVTSGISIHADLVSFMTITWENKKERFWNTMKEIFLKYYK
jgi:hypothetical protein